VQPRRPRPRLHDVRIPMSGPRALLFAATAVLAVVTVLLVVVPLTRGPAAASGAPATPAAAASAPEPARTTEATQPAADAHSAASQPTQAQLDAARCTGGPGGKWVRVSITLQRAWLCDGTALTLATPVTTGADTPDRRTLPGTWQVQGKETHRWLGGPGYSVQVDFWMPYDGDFGFHDAGWQTMPFGSPGWRTEGSHGCVHLPHAAMAELYDWAPVGTTVTIEA
jgi:lipoprotein-anchoring transpeptidase ErfK/SrfK